MCYRCVCGEVIYSNGEVPMVRLVSGTFLVALCFCLFVLEYGRFLGLDQPNLLNVLVFAALGLPTGVGIWLIDNYEQPQSKLDERMERLMAPYRAAR